ncbi:hypothetical protein [Psychrobacter sp. I-STPA10]|uniref:hypothetical protein n=1 Tax=Psychrobacter sp. I-STPA10 TaxID=2585769 RepID=UPI001E3FE06C|nr:hypothetical protein [Psychrobacter sp. I-STPA10]
MTKISKSLTLPLITIATLSATLSGCANLSTNHHNYNSNDNYDSYDNDAKQQAAIDHITDKIAKNMNDKEAEQFLLSDSTKNWLKSALPPQDYKNFYNNVVYFNATSTLKNGSKYYEARQNNNFKSYDDGLGLISGIVVNPDGFFYLAYTQPNSQSNSNQMTYITNDSKCQSEVHDAIKVVSHIYQKSPDFRLVKSTQEKPSNHDCSEVYGRELPSDFPPRSAYRLAN